MDYIEFKVEILSEEIPTEVVLAYLSEFKFESFVEKENTVFAYIQENDFDNNEILSHYFFATNKEKLSISIISVKDKNWNEEWESNYDPVLIDNRCLVRAPFHTKNKNAIYDIVIEPKMSFGTAHHPTTELMIKLLLDMDVKGMKVLDMGCGTGVLAILTSLKGADEVTAIDNSDWAYYNTVENIEKNEANIKAFLGDAEILNDFTQIEVFIANINRNVLLNDIPIYKSSIAEGGFLLLSGFFEKDLKTIEEKCKDSGFKLIEYINKEEWVAAKFKKI